jgi:hypothetical protein
MVLAGCQTRTTIPLVGSWWDIEVSWGNPGSDSLEFLPPPRVMLDTSEVDAAERSRLLVEAPGSLPSIHRCAYRTPGWYEAALRSEKPAVLTRDQVHLIIGLDVEPSAQLREILSLIRDSALEIDVDTVPPRGPLSVWRSAPGP